MRSPDVLPFVGCRYFFFAVFFAAFFAGFFAAFLVAIFLFSLSMILHRPANVFCSC
jgi:hypothetical protein